MKISNYNAAELETLASIIDSEDAIFSQDLNGIITSWNIRAEKLFGYSASEAIGKSVSLIEPDHPNEMKTFLGRLNEGERIEHYETVRIRKDGKKVDVLFLVYPILGSAGELIGALSIARDITAQKRLLVDRHFLASIVDSTTDAVLTKDMDGIILSWNKAAEHIYGYSAEEIIGKPVFMLTPPFKKDEIPLIMERLRKGERIEPYETQRMRKDQTVIDISLTVSPVKDDKGRIIAASAIARDITDKKKTEELIRRQLEEKNLLIEEVYHRVKNNLQILSSLLELRSRNLQSEETKSAFKETIQRIRAIALIHENMYRSDNLAAINFKEYVQLLSEQLLRAYSAHPDNIEMQITGETSNLKLYLALPLGLIFNELLTNTIKYAFKDGQGKIDITLEEKDSVLNIVISDNGVGLPENVDPLKSDTFGFRIVRLLTEQLGGQLEVKRENGTIFILSIPK
jgi:PAS domain S-box-containing protein